MTKCLANWTPLTNEEKELFDKRLEFGAKNRRRFWEMKYNPKTEGYFCGQTSDRAWAQHDWVNSVWFEQAACNNSTTYFKLVSFIKNRNHQKIIPIQIKLYMAMGLLAGCYTSYVYNQNMLGPGMFFVPFSMYVFISRYAKCSCNRHGQLRN